MKAQLSKSDKHVASLNQQLEEKCKQIVEIYADELEQLTALETLYKREEKE